MYENQMQVLQKSIVFAEREPGVHLRHVNTFLWDRARLVGVNWNLGAALFFLFMCIPKPVLCRTLEMNMCDLSP